MALLTLTVLTLIEAAAFVLLFFLIRKFIERRERLRARVQFAIKQAEIDHEWTLELSRAMAELYAAVTTSAPAEKIEASFVKIQILSDRRSPHYDTLLVAAKALMLAGEKSDSSHERIVFLDMCQDALQDRKMLSDKVYGLTIE